jgi:hypothetical protein
VWLDVDVDTAWERARGTGRPLARERETFMRLHAEREPIYANLANVTVPAQRPDRMADVLEALEGIPEDTRVLWAAAGDYPAYIGSGLMQSFWPATVDGRRFVVTDGNVGRLYGVEPVVATVSVMPGE